MWKFVLNIVADLQYYYWIIVVCEMRYELISFDITRLNIFNCIYPLRNQNEQKPLSQPSNVGINSKALHCTSPSSSRIWQCLHIQLTFSAGNDYRWLLIFFVHNLIGQNQQWPMIEVNVLNGFACHRVVISLWLTNDITGPLLVIYLSLYVTRVS